MWGRYSVRLVLCGGAMLVAASLWWAAVAGARAFHAYEGQISSVPANEPSGHATRAPGPLVEVNAMAVDEGSLFVAENAGEVARVDEFDAASREFQAQLPEPTPYNPFVNYRGVAVSHAGGGRQLYAGYFGGGLPSAVAVYEGSAGNVWRFGGLWSGPAEGESFGSVRGVAVDDSHAVGDGDAGDVYVSDWEDHVVDLLQPGAEGTETLVARITEAGHSVLEHPAAVAVDQSNGDVAIADATEPEHNVYSFTVYVLAPETMAGSYRLLETLTGPPGGSFGEVTGVAFDDSADEGAGDVFVAEGTPSRAGRVYEFMPTGGLKVALNGATTPQGGFGEVMSLATDPATGQVWVGDRHEEGQAKTVHGFADRFGELVVVPTPVTGLATNVRFVEEAGGEWSARLNGTVNPENAGNVTLCQFVWGENRAATDQTAGCTTSVANGDSAVSVHANIGDLAPDTTYFYRLQAGNAHGVSEGEPVEDRQFTTPGPGLRSVSASGVTASSGLLEAVVDPHTAPAGEQDFQEAAKVAPSYFFQYSTSPTGECGVVVCARAPVGAASVGFGPGQASLSQQVSGLAADSRYHYRLVVEAETSAGVMHVFYGPEESFLTRRAAAEGAASGLLDGRGWEQVSPVDKRGGEIFGLVRGNGQRAPIQASPDGGAMTYGAYAPTEPEPAGFTSAMPVLSRRGSSGWSSVDLATPRVGPTEELVATPEYQLASEDLSRSLLVPLGGGAALLSNQASEFTPYLRNQPACATQGTGPAGECFTPLLDSADLPAGTSVGEAVNKLGIVMEGATDDLKHVLLKSTVALTAAPITGPELYEWSQDPPAEQQIQPVSVLPGNEGGMMDDAGDVTTGSDPEGNFSAARNAISQDGSRVFWSDAGESGRRLFMRELASEETIRLDVPETSVGVGEPPKAMFQLASTDGSRVLFTDTQRLTANASVDREAHYGDLYECRIVREVGHDHCDLTDLTPESNGQAADVQNLVLGASKNAEYVYFVADGAMAPGAVRGTCTINSDAAGELCNLYVEHEGVLRLVAVLEGGDESDWGDDNTTAHGVGYLTVRVSGNGQFVAFMSRRSLTGYDNRDVHSGVLDQEVFLYDAQGGGLVCVSCDPTGARPAGVEAEQLWRSGAANLAAVPLGPAAGRDEWVAGNLPGWEEVGTSGAALYEPRNLSDEGRLFFNSSDGLVSGDVNGAEDVYEFEPVGVGSCSSASVLFVQVEGGCVGLVSSGLSGSESGFLDASESGGDVFFLTAEKLVSGDTDGALDVYDARVCSAAAPCSQPAGETVPCETAEGCRASGGGQAVVFGAPASGTFEGPGNWRAVSSKAAGGRRGRSGAAVRRRRLARALRGCERRFSRRPRARRSCVRRVRARFASTGGRGGHGKRGGR